MNIVQTILENGEFPDLGTLTMFALDHPDEQVIVEWNDDSRSQHAPHDALEKITLARLMGKHPTGVFLTSESLERLRDKTAEQGTLFFKVASLLYKYDVEKIVFDEREHEYECEAGAIIPRLPECQNAQDCARMIQQVFAKLFAGRVTPLECYQELGKAVWNVWQAEQLTKPSVEIIS